MRRKDQQEWVEKGREFGALVCDEHSDQPNPWSPAIKRSPFAESDLSGPDVMEPHVAEKSVRFLCSMQPWS